METYQEFAARIEFRVDALITALRGVSGLEEAIVAGLENEFLELQEYHRIYGII